MKMKPLAGVYLLCLVLPPVTILAASPPSITTQPQSQGVLAGSNAVFSVNASGSPTPAYQWFFNAARLTNSPHINGATNATLTVSNVSYLDGGNYYVVATNSRGSATSSNALLTVVFTNRLHYVNLNGANPSPPYGDWSTAATNIQDAVDIANSGDTVFVTNGVYTLGNRVTGSDTNCVVAAIPVAIVGVSGPAQTVIDGGGAKRCVYLTNGAVLTGFTLTNGNASSGGGVACASLSAAITNCVLIGNTAAQYGGGAYLGSLTHCTLAGNSSGGDGGAAAGAFLVNCLLCTNYSGVGGGGAQGGELDNCTLLGNHASQSGGGASFATMRNCVVTANSADNYQGGGVDSCTLYDCILSNNSAGQWGGNASESTLSNCWLTGGTAYLGGGARTSTLIACVLSNNLAPYGQGGGANASTLTNCVLIGNVAWYTGGGADSSTIVNSLILSNAAPYGGGVNGCSVTNSALVGNNAYDPYAGGGGGASGGTLYNCLLAGNTSVLNAGGALQSTLVNCTVTGNAADGDGGGVDSSTLTNCIVYFNSSPVNGNYSGTNYMSWCQTTPLPAAGTGDVVIGVSNISSAPVFADAPNGNYRLYPGSPGIDAGNNSAAPLAVDADGDPRIVNGTVDLGAYEFQNFPFIEVQPVSQTVPFGQPSVSFSVFAVGPGTLTYQWLFNGTNMTGKTNSTLTLTFVEYNQAGNYSVRVMNSAGAALSSNAVLTVVPPTPPSFVSQPVTNLVVPVGTNILLSVSVTGAPPPALQWYFNGNALGDNSHYTGTATATLQVSNVQTNDTGSYFVVATNTGGALTSSVAAVTVLMPPAITLQPASQTVVQNSNVTFIAAVAGGAPLSYQWLFNGIPLTDGGQISGSATTNLAISSLQFTNGGNYVLLVTNPVGSALSTTAVLTVKAPPAIIRQPADMAAQWGASASFSVIVIGSPPLHYQWSLNGTNLAGATNSVLSLNNLQPSQAGNYAVTITNDIGSVASSNAILTVNLPPPGVPFIAGFSPLTAYPGAPVTISGTNFNSTANSNTVYFGATRAAVIAASVTNLLVTVPAGATFGPITETVGGLVAYSDRLFEPTFPGNGSNITANSFASGFNLGTAVNPGSAVIADLDGDGKPDIALVSGGSHVVCVFRNISTNGVPLSAASFAPRVDLPFPTTGISGNPYRLRAVDLDGDGRLDLMAEEASGARVSIFHNVAVPGSLTTNSFEPAFSLTTGNDCRFATATDLDGDGRPDIVALNYGDKTISIFQNIGSTGVLNSNSFAAPMVLAAPGGPYEAVIADLDGDGKPDLAVANQDNGTVSIYQNFATAGVLTANSFAPRVDLPGDINPDTLAAVDLDGDGKLDLVVGAVQSETVAVYRNLGSNGTLATNSFAPRVSFGTSDWTHTVAVADFDGDARPDVAVVGELPSMMSIFQNASAPGGFTNSSFLPRVDFGTGWNAWGVAVGDLDGDGRPDIIFCNDYDNTLTVYQNQAPYGGAPVIIAQPGNLTAPLNNTAQLAATAIGQAPLGYQWFFNGTNLTDNGRIIGSTTSGLSISNALLADSGNYQLVVTNAFGATTSAVAVVTVIILPPTFPLQPQNQAAIVGSNATFTAGVSGSLPMAFQWFTNGGPLIDGGRVSGSTTASLAIAGVQTNDAINYWLVASNAAGVATSSVVNLTVVLPVVITLQPTNQTLAVGATFALTATADGSGPFGYQWYFNNSPLSDSGRISGSATATLIVTNAQTSDTGNYTVVVTNQLTAATSSNAAVTVLTPPGFKTQPVGRSTPLGVTNIFSAAATGAGTLLYQWRLNGTDIPGATNTSYFIAATGTNDLGVYQLVVSNAVSVAVSSNAWLTLGPVAAWGNNTYNQCLVPPGLSNVTSIAGGTTYSLASLLDGSIVAWGNATSYTNSSWTNVLAVAASVNGALGLKSDGSVVGSGYINPLSFQIYPSNVVAVASGNGFGLALRAEGTVVSWGSPVQSAYIPMSPPPGLVHVTAISAGYQHALALRSDGTVAAWGIGSATNVPFGLSNVVAIAAGSGHSLALKADGTLVAWGVGVGTNIPPGLSNVVAVTAANSSEPNYGAAGGSSVSYAVRSNGTVVAWGFSAYGQTNVPSGLSNVVTVANGTYHTLALVNDGRPQILRQPAGGTAWSGRDWMLQAAAAGVAPLNYQWLFNGTNLAGATNSVLLLPAIQSGNAGNYQVVVSNALGVAASFSVPLTVRDSVPFLLTQPATNLYVFLGSRVVLSTAVAGSGPLQLQWQFNSNNIPGATNDTLVFDHVRLTNTGSYALIASNSFGVVTSAVINLTVQQVVVWGNTTLYGVTNMPPGLTNVAAISANFYGNIVLRNDGTVAIWGDSGYVGTNTAAGISNVVEVSAGYLTYLALKSTGQPYVWGYGLGSVFSNAVVGQSNIVAIEAGNGSCALLRNDGSVVWVTPNGGTTVPGLTNAVALEPFDNGFLALRADGTVYPWQGGAAPPPTLTNVLALASGRYQGLAVKRDGRIQDWPAPMLSAGTSNIIAVATAGINPGPEFAVRADGTVMNGGLGAATNVPYGLARVVRLDAGYNHCLALLADRDFPPVFLHNALNTSAFVVSSKGAPQWFGQANVSHDGVNAAQSAPIGDNLSTSMRTWVAGPVTVSFWWKVSSETNHDFLNFSAGGVVLTNISGEADWQQCTVTVPPGNQILQWTYAKDASGAAGQDAGWVDQLQFIAQPPVISTQPASQQVVGPTNVVLSVGATGTPPLTYRWWKDGSLVPGANAASLVLLNAVRTNSGTYWVVVTNAATAANTVTSSNAVLEVIVPQLLGTPTFQPDGTIVLSTTDIGGGQLIAADLANCQVQVSSNLVDWVTLPGALVLTNGTVELQDPGATNAPQRYYRILENW